MESRRDTWQAFSSGEWPALQALRLNAKLLLAG